MTTSQRLDERYGLSRARRTRRIAVAIAGSLGVVALGVLAWVTYAHAADAVDVDTTGFVLDSPQQVEISFQVTPPPGRAFACALEAQDDSHGIVGWRIVEYDALATRPAAFTETLPTVAAATTGLVDACWVT